jgi:uncharacterized phage protein gp47/JayE
MAFKVPTLDESHAFLVALFKALFPEADVSEESFNWKWALSQAGGVTDNHAHIQAVKAALMPTTAEREDLVEWGVLTGVTKKPATGAHKSNALRVFGTAAASVPIDSELTHASGLRYRIAEAAVVGGGGSVDVDVEAIDVGAATRLNADEVLTFASVPPGLEEQARLVVALDEDGEDEEGDPAYRLRILSRLADPPLGGARHDYEQWALEVAGISAAFAYPLRNGIGSVDLAALHAGSGTARILSVGEMADLQAYLDEKRPVSMATLRLLTVVDEAVNVELVIVPSGESQYEFDWDDATPPVVSTWTPGTRTLVFTAPRPGTMTAGDRIVIATANSTGQPYVIEALSSTDAVVLEEVPSVAPVATNVVYSGGPLVDPVRTAVLALFDGLGTANPDSNRYGPWEGTLRISALLRVASGVAGVVDAEEVEPVANVAATDPAFPGDYQIGLLVPGRVIARRKH